MPRTKKIDIDIVSDCSEGESESGNNPVNIKRILVPEDIFEFLGAGKSIFFYKI